VDVVIPTYNNRDLVLRCVDALNDPVIAQVIVVDDVSSDDTLEALGSQAPAVRVVALNAQAGLAHALNRGAGCGAAPLVLFLNDDVIAEPGAVALLVARIMENPELTFAGGRLVDALTFRTQTRYKPRALPTALTFAARLTGVERCWRANPWSGQHLRDPLPDNAPRQISLQPAGACLLVPRSCLDRIGGWDEAFWFWYEDVDLIARLLKMGEGMWEPRAVFRHVGRHSTRSWDRHRQHARLYHSSLRYALKHLSRLGRVAVALLAFLSFVLRIAHHGSRGHWEAVHVYGRLAAQALAVVSGLEPGPPYTIEPPRRR
jgi:GT2 family glycosyltransferase